MAKTKELCKDVRDMIVDPNKAVTDRCQAAGLEGDNSWCDYLQMEDTIQDLTHENSVEPAQNHSGGTC